VPPGFAYIFKGKEGILSSHQAYDYGAANLASRLAKRLQSPVYPGFITRLLIDLNRSPLNRNSLYSPFSRKLQRSDRELLKKKYYFPYRKKVDETIGRIIAEHRPVLHISVHSFVPVKNGIIRNADIGLLYDPARKIEKYICSFLAALLQEKVVTLRVRRNYPYLGKADGFTSFLRNKYSAEFYAGIEIEINQSLLTSGGNTMKETENVLTEGIKNVLKLQDFYQFKKI
jgi:predicted N-formylglutamate amidohydrolase